MVYKGISWIIGYCFGCVLTADIVAKRVAGSSASEVGETGNPGMANIMAALGFRPGIITLAGDLGKCIIAALISWLLFRNTGAGRIVTLYAGFGCTVGHDFPFWRKFRGGKGVATTSMTIVIYAFPWGLLANIAGMLTVFLTKYLCVGGPVIPLVFAVSMVLRGDTEAGCLAALMTLLSLFAHRTGLAGIRDRSTAQTDVPGAIRKKLRETGKK